MSEFLSDDGELAALKARCYRGIVKVPLNTLDFDHPLVLGKRREISEQNVQRLERIFERNGCLRLQEENVVNAVVLDQELPILLSSSAPTVEQLRQVTWARDAPALNLGNIRCLSGLHRIEAAKRYLDENDKWWPVRLFSADIPKPYLTRIVESFLNEQKPSDGEIFRKIRLYHRQKDEEAENRWWACLDKSKLRDLRQVLKKKELAAAFDALIDMPGLWARIQLGALQRLLALKCDEEMTAYLHHVKRAWNDILQCGGEVLAPSIVDAATVEKLESLAPSHSEIDRDLVQAMMQKSELFPSQHDDNVRLALLDNVCSYPGLIPSLWTFFETLKYLEPICEALRKLLGGRIKRTIRTSLRSYYFAPEKPVIQVSGTKDVELTANLSEEEAARVSYVELWAFCARHFDDLTTFTPKMECKGTKPLVRGPNPVVWQCFAKFAMSRGFMTPRAKELSEDTCDSQLAIDYLRKANPLSTSFNAALVEKVVAAGRSQTLVDNEDIEPDDNFITVERRSGRPYELDLVKDKKTLFFAHLYVGRTSNNISLNLVRRDLFLNIFGPLHFEHVDLGPFTRHYRTAKTEEDMDTDSPESEEDTHTHNNTVQHHHEMLQRDYEAQKLTLQEALGCKATLNQNLETIRRECEQLKTQKSNLQDQLEECRKSNDKNLQTRVDKIVQLEYDNKKYREMALKATTSWDDAVNMMKEAERQRRFALEELNHYKGLALDLQKQIDQQCLPVSGPSLLQQSETDSPSMSNALAKNLGDLASMVSDTGSHSTWTSPNTSHIIFIAVSNASNGRPKGFECEISKEEAEASHTLESILDMAKQHFSDLIAWDTVGKVVSTSSMVYLFEVLSSGTVFVGPDLVFQTFLDKRANEIGSQVPRKIKQMKRIRDARAHPTDPKNYKEVVRFESSSDSEVYESAADEDQSDRHRKVPSQSIALNIPDSASRPREDPFRAVLRSGDDSDSESDKSADRNASFRQKRVLFQ